MARISDTVAWITHYSDVIMSAMVSRITSVSIVCSTACSGADQTKRESFASLAFVMGIRRWPLDSPHKGPVTPKCLHLVTSSWVKCQSSQNPLTLNETLPRIRPALCLPDVDPIPDGARQSAGTTPNAKFDIYTSKFLWLSTIPVSSLYRSDYMSFFYSRQCRSKTAYALQNGEQLISINFPSSQISRVLEPTVSYLG